MDVITYPSQEYISVEEALRVNNKCLRENLTRYMATHRAICSHVRLSSRQSAAHLDHTHIAKFLSMIALLLKSCVHDFVKINMPVIQYILSIL